jgi:hypothetical protein
MGLVYLKTGKHKYAEHHFRRAAEINPTNAVLLCCIGMVRRPCAIRFQDSDKDCLGPGAVGRLDASFDIL